MSRQRVGNKKPGFGKRGSENVKPAERKAPSVGRLTQIYRRWWGKKTSPKKQAQKGFGFKRSRLEIR